jgi:hypothetical protein
MLKMVEEEEKFIEERDCKIHKKLKIKVNLKKI